MLMSARQLSKLTHMFERTVPPLALLVYVPDMPGLSWQEMAVNAYEGWIVCICLGYCWGMFESNASCEIQTS